MGFRDRIRSVAAGTKTGTGTGEDDPSESSASACPVCGRPLDTDGRSCLDCQEQLRDVNDREGRPGPEQ